MATSREDDQSQTIAELERELHQLRCELREVREELDWQQEKNRVQRRIIERLA